MFFLSKTQGQAFQGRERKVVSEKTIFMHMLHPVTIDRQLRKALCFPRLGGWEHLSAWVEDGGNQRSGNLWGSNPGYVLSMG